MHCPSLVLQRPSKHRPWERTPNWWGKVEERKKQIHIKLTKRISPVQHRTCSRPVCGHYEDTERENLHNYYFFKQYPAGLGLFFFFYLTGVSRAGLWNVAFIRSFTARNTSQLILSEEHRQCEKQIKHKKQSITDNSCAKMLHNQQNSPPCSPCSTVRCCT